MSIGAITKMAQQTSGNSRTLINGQAVLMLDPDQIIVEKQVRKKLKNIEELAVSIEQNDQQQPIIVRKAPEQRDKYILEKGERRLAACRLKGLQVAAIVSNAKYDSITAHAGQLVENIQRDNLEPFDIADGLQRFIDEPNGGWTQRKIAAYIGKGPGYVSLYLALAKTPNSIRQLYDDEVVQDPEMLNSIRQLAELEPEWEKALIQQLVDQKKADKRITRAQIRNWLAWAKEAVELGEKPSEYIAKQEAASNAPQQAASQASNPELPDTTRPGLNVGAGYLLDDHQGPVTGADDDNGSDVPAKDKTATSTTTTTTTTTVETDLEDAEEEYQEDQGDIFASELDVATSPASTTAQSANEGHPVNEPDQAAPAAKSKTSKWPILHNGYVEYAPGQLIVYVEVDGQQGELMTNLMDDQPDYVWVMIDSKKQRVHVDDARISCIQPHSDGE